MGEMRIELHSTDGGSSRPPEWATGPHDELSWYFANEHGEQWVARLFGTELRIAGMDLGWKGFTFRLADVEKNLAFLRAQLSLRSSELLDQLFTDPEVREQVAAVRELGRKTGATPPVISGYILNDGEAYWLVGVMEAALPTLKWRANKTTGQ
ncbi:MAG: hypothetical protein ACM3XM_10125 [Mycobacterium leprae]